MKKLLILGGSLFQIPAIEYAKRQGHYVITCDYLPDNPGHRLADEYHNISTTDIPSVLALSKKLRIDGILPYASDPAAPTAAYVSEHLGLPGIPYSICCIMTEKDKFRAFLKENNFNCPHFQSFTDFDSMMDIISESDLPLVIKPVDSSGGKGVAVVEAWDTIDQWYDYAIQFSRSKRIIVEQYIEGKQLHGDGYVKDGRLVFMYLGDQLVRGKLNVSTMYPSTISQDLMIQIRQEIERFINVIGLQEGAINIEIRLRTTDQQIFIIEIGARNGGNYTPDLVKIATGFDAAKATVNAALGLPYEDQKWNPKGYFMNLVLFAEQAGKYCRLELSEYMQQRARFISIYRKEGEQINIHKTSQNSIGLALMSFDSLDEMHAFAAHPHTYYKVIVQ